MELTSSAKKHWLQPTIVYLDSKSTQDDACTTAGKIGGFADGTLDVNNNACGTS